MQHKCNAYSMHTLQCTYFTRVKQYNMLNWFELMMHNIQILHISCNDNNWIYPVPVVIFIYIRSKQVFGQWSKENMLLVMKSSLSSNFLSQNVTSFSRNITKYKTQNTEYKIQIQSKLSPQGGGGGMILLNNTTCHSLQMLSFNIDSIAQFFY